MERKRFYVGLIVFDNNKFYMGGAKTKELNEGDYELHEMSYGVYHAYVDMVEKAKGEYMLERFGVENGSYSRKGNDALIDMDYYISVDNVVGVFNAETFTPTEEFMSGMFEKEICTVIDGIRIPAIVVNNEHFIVDTGYASGVKKNYKAYCEKKTGIGTIAFEWVVNDFGLTEVKDAHDGYAECVAADEKDEKKVCDYKEPLEPDGEAEFMGDDFVQTECKYFNLEEMVCDYEANSICCTFEDWKYGSATYVKTYELDEDKLTTNDESRFLYNIEKHIHDLTKTIELVDAKPRRVEVRISGMTNKPLNINIVF